MAGGYVVGVASETKAFGQGIKTGVIEPLEDARERLDDLGKSRGPDDLERDLRGAQRATEKLADETKQAADRIEREFRDAYRRTKDSSDDATRGAKQGFDELADEANSSARETAASFDGSAESIIDLFQEVAANAFAGFGAAGAVAGLAAAAGIGFAASAIENADEQAEQSRENVASLIEAYIEAPGKAQPGIDAMADRLRELATTTDEGSDSLLTYKKLADESGLSFRKLATLTNLSVGEVRDVWREADRAAREYGERIESEGYSEELGNAQNAARAYRDEVGRTIGEMERAAEAEKAWAAAGGEALETRALAVGTYQDAIDQAVSGFDEFKNAESGALDPAGYLASIQARIDATASFNSNVQSLATQFGLTDSEIQYILDQGLDFAPMLQSIIDSGLQGEFIGQIQAAMGGGQDVVNGTDLSTTIAVEANTDPADEGLRKTANEDRKAKPITAEADTTKAEKALDATASKARTARITAEADVAAAERALDRLAERRTATIVARVVDRHGRAVD